jgi:hypothetical protein
MFPNKVITIQLLDSWSCLDFLFFTTVHWRSTNRSSSMTSQARILWYITIVKNLPCCHGDYSWYYRYPDGWWIWFHLTGPSPARGISSRAMSRTADTLQTMNTTTPRLSFYGHLPFRHSTTESRVCLNLSHFVSACLNLSQALVKQWLGGGLCLVLMMITEIINPF